MLNFSFFGLFLLATIYASTSAFDDEVAEKRYAGNMHMGFGKRASTVPFFGLGKRAFSQFHMGLGKREADDEAEAFYYSPEDDSIDSQKRYDINRFHMGFGKRSMNDAMKRFSSNQFHMGLGKKFDVNFPGKPSSDNDWGKDHMRMLNKLKGRDLYMYLCHPVRLAMLLKHAIDLRNVCPM